MILSKPNSTKICQDRLKFSFDVNKSMYRGLCEPFFLSSKLLKLWTYWFLGSGILT